MATATAQRYRTSRTVKKLDLSGEHRGDMEGTTHAATGFLAGLALGLLTSTGAHGGMVAADNIGRDLLYGAVTCGMALLPDADHPQASFAHAAGPFSHGISHLVATVFGGHREGTHSAFGIGVMTLLTAAGSLWFPSHWALGVLAAFLALLISAGLSATGFRRHGLEALAAGCVIAALAVFFVRAELWWLTALGMAVHVFEDEFTGHGCALLWPLTRRRFGGDGRQPVRRRQPSEFRRQRAAAEREEAPVHVPAGWANRVAGSEDDSESARAEMDPGRTRKAMCTSCWVGECEDCKDPRCECTDHDHPGRPRKKKPVPVVAPVLEDYDPAADVPPF